MITSAYSRLQEKIMQLEAGQRVKTVNHFYTSIGVCRRDYFGAGVAAATQWGTAALPVFGFADAFRG
jgi:hypothetical protein